MQSDMFHSSYAKVFDGDDRWRSLPSPTGERFEWDETSTYIRNPPFFEGITLHPTPPSDKHSFKLGNRWKRPLQIQSTQVIMALNGVRMSPTISGASGEVVVIFDEEPTWVQIGNSVSCAAANTGSQ